MCNCTDQTVRSFHCCLPHFLASYYSQYGTLGVGCGRIRWGTLSLADLRPRRRRYVFSVTFAVGPAFCLWSMRCRAVPRLGLTNISTR